MKDKEDNAEQKKQGDEYKAAFDSLRKEMAEREKAEAALRRSDRDYRNLFENAHDAILIFRPEDEVILEVNKRACDLYGFDRSEFIGMSLEKISKDILHGRKHIKITMDKGDFHHLESVHYRKDGTEMTMEINASVVNYQGQWAILSINRDVTERKRALDARLQSEMKFRKLVEQSLQGLVIAQGLSPRLVFANLALADILGYTVTELLSLSPEGIQGLVHPDDRAQFFSNYQDRLKGKPVPSRYEFRTLHKDGSVRWVEILSNRIEYSGQPAVQAAFLDITTRKEAEGELRRLNRTLKLVTSCDRALVQATKEAEFLYEICLLAVEVGGYRLAWVGFADNDPEKTVRPAAQAGYEAGYLESVKISWDENSQWSRGPTGTAIRTGKAVVCRNIPTDPAFALWREKAIKRGYVSSIALPLVTGGLTFGAFNIYAPETDAFDTEEVTFLTELANDLAYGIHVLRTRAASHRVEEALRDSEEKNRLVVENSQQGILVLQDGKIQFANPRTFQHSGYSLDELTSRPFLELIHPEDRAMVSERYEKRLKGKETFEVYQFRFLDKQGRVQWVEANSVQVSWKGRPASLSFLSDITERKRAEEALRESEERYRIVVENLGEGIGIADLDERFTFVNPAAEAIFGVPPGNLVGRTLEEFTTPEQYDEVLKQTGKRKFGERSSYDLEIVRPDGGRRSLLVTACPRNDPQGRFTGTFGIFRDITERKQAEQTLRESEIKYRSLVDGSRQGIMIAQGVPPRIVFANPAMAEILGSSQEELTSMPPEEMKKLVHPDDLAVFFQRYRERLEGGKPPPRYEVRAVRKDGTMRWTGMVSSQIEYHGKPAVQAVFQDITERKRTEEALKESEAHFRLLAENVKDVIWTLDMNLRFTFFSPSVQRQLGYTVEEAKGLSLKEILTSASFEKAMQTFHEEIALEDSGRADPDRSRTLDVETVCKDGSAIWNEVTMTFLRDLTGRAVGILGVTRDISGRRKVEEALRQSEVLSRAVLDHSPVGISVRDKSGVLLQVNEAWKKIWALSDTDIQENERWSAGRSWKERFPYLGNNTGDVEQLFSPEENLSILFLPEIEIKEPRPGAAQWISQYLYVLRNPEGQADKVVTLTQDITARKQAEQAVKESDTKYRGIVDHALLGIYITQGHIMKFCNQRLAEIFGYGSPEELFGISIQNLIAPESWKTVDQEVKRRESGEVQEVHYEFKGRRKDGQTIDLEVLGGRILYEGRPAIQGSMIDVTEHKRLEERVLQLQKMEAIGRLSGGVAHDFNNLLQGVSGYAEAALRKLPEDDPSRKYLEGIEEAVEKGASLTHQLLAFSRKQVFQPVVIEINEIVRDSEKMLRRLIGEDIEIVTHLDPEAGRVKVDPVQIEQVIMNLVVNARDAMPQGGRLTLETAPVDLGPVFIRSHPDLYQGPHVMLTIADTGCGMDAETLAHIYEPFFTTKEKGKGTGLGLATVYGIVRQSGGGIEVQSTPGKGTTFKVYLPRAGQETDAKKAVATLPELPGGTETVLLAEDEEALRGMIRENLSQAGYTVLEAENGEAALRVFTQHPEPVHLLIADVVMPKMSGPDLARHLAAHHPELKVIFISGYPDDATFSRGLKPLGLAFLQKPFKPHVLLRKIRDVLDIPSQTG